MILSLGSYVAQGWSHPLLPLLERPQSYMYAYNICVLSFLRVCAIIVPQVIHVGELFGDSVSMTPGQSPWGRTTSRECQEELSSKFHCILKVAVVRGVYMRMNAFGVGEASPRSFHFGGFVILYLRSSIAPDDRDLLTVYGISIFSLSAPFPLVFCHCGWWRPTPQYIVVLKPARS